MVRDRLPDLFASRRNDPIGKRFLEDICVQLSQNRRLQNILDDADKIRGMIDLLQDNVNIVKSLFENNLSHINSDIQAELEKQILTVSEKAIQIRYELEKIGKKLPTIKDSQLRSGQVHERVQTLQYFTMLQTFSIVMYDYNESLMRYYAHCSSIRDQQKQILKKKNIDSQLLADQENDDNPMSRLFVDNFLNDTKITKLQLSELQSRHTEIIKLEKSLIKIRDMFLDLAFLVEKQGDQLNCVEYFAEQASEQVDNGRYKISKVEKQKNKNRKKKITFFSFFTIVILILLIVIIYL